MSLKKISNKEEFKSTIMEDKAIIMIHKTNCPFCEKAFPWVKKHAIDNPNLIIAEVNEKDISDVLKIFQVKMYPTFVAFSEGKVVDIFYGDTKEDKIKDFIEKNK